MTVIVNVPDSSAANCGTNATRSTHTSGQRHRAEIICFVLSTMLVSATIFCRPEML